MVQGIVITGSMDIHRFGRDFDWSHFSIVSCGRYHASLPFHTVRPNIFKAVKMAFVELMSRGYHRIGFAMGRHNTLMEDDQARHGAAIALESSYLPKKDQLPVYSGLIDDIPSFLAWVEKCRPDAIVGFGVRYYWHLREKGFVIPENIGFASMHLPSQEDKGFCAGLDQDSAGIARQTILFLDQLIRHRERGVPASPLELLVPPVWNEAPTLRPRPNALAAQRI
jgi:DNA-binding LacI/PurR family transcriptional regulator